MIIAILLTPLYYYYFSNFFRDFQLNELIKKFKSLSESEKLYSILIIVSLYHLGASLYFSSIIMLSLIVKDMPDFKGRKTIRVLGVTGSILFPLIYLFALLQKKNRINRMVLKIPKDQKIIYKTTSDATRNDLNSNNEYEDAYKQAVKRLQDERQSSYHDQSIETLVELSMKGYYQASYFLGDFFSSTQIDLDTAWDYTIISLTHDNLTSEEKSNSYILLAKIVTSMGYDKIHADVEEENYIVLMMDCLYKAKELNHPDADYYLGVAYENFDFNFNELKELLDKDSPISAIIADYKQNNNSNQEASNSFRLHDVNNSNKKISKVSKKTYSLAELNEYREVKSLALIRVITLIIFLTLSMGIIIYAFITKPEYKYGLYFLAVFVAGIPNIAKAYREALGRQDRMNRFWGKEYKATIDLDNNTIKVRKNHDWVNTLITTLFRVLTAGIEAPSELIKTIKIYRKVNQILKESEDI